MPKTRTARDADSRSPAREVSVERELHRDLDSRPSCMLCSSKEPRGLGKVEFKSDGLACLVEEIPRQLSRRL